MFHSLGLLLRYPLYLWILGVYPIFHLYSVNIGIVNDYEFVGSVAVMLVLSSVAFFFTRPLVSNPHKRAFMLAICSLVFSLSGHIYVMIYMPRSLLVWNLASGALTFILLVASHRYVPQRIFAVFTVPFNLIFVTLFAIQVASIALEAISMKDISQMSSEYARLIADRPEAPKVYDSATMPDIYYIVPDGYPSDAWKQATMNYDNFGFTSALEARGFVVAPHAQSNYGFTILSLASILNMKFFDENPSSFNDLDYLNLSIANSEVSRMLQQLGYTYVQFISGYFAPSASADLIRDFTPGGPIELILEYDVFSQSVILDTGSKVLVDRLAAHLFRQPFIPHYIDTTALRILRSRVERILGTEVYESYDRIAPQRLPAAIDEIEAIVSMPEATFTFVHILKPHLPVTFDERGEFIRPVWFPSRSTFFAEFEFVNSEFLRLIDTILQGSRNPPIIIFQADHGSTLGDNWSEEGRKTLFDTYAAYYLPKPYSIDIPKPFTLVNSFPLILNEVFGTDIQLQLNTLIETRRSDAHFEQQDVTAEFMHN